MSNLYLYKIEKDYIRENLNKYTKKAFELIPKIKNPHILDIGCGTGVPTIQLAKISDGNVTAVDIDKSALNLFKRKIKETRLINQVNIFEDSILTMDFPEKNFDIIWAEGSIYVMGFEQSIKKWHRFLKPSGFLVIHDENKDKIEKLQVIPKYGYRLIAQFEISAESWWLVYYTPLEQLIQKFHDTYPKDLELHNELEKDQGEIDKCKSNSIVVSSFFVIMQKM